MAPWLGLIFGVVAALYALAPPIEPARPLAGSAALASLALFAGGYAIARVPDALVHPVVIAIVLACVGAALAFVGLTGDPSQTVVLVIILLGASCVLIQPVAMLFVIAAALGGWAVLAADFEPGVRLHWLINLVTSSALAVVISWARAGTLAMLERERADVERARRALAAQAAELEIARDEALESARTKAEFLARMSHELRTPLGGIIGLSQLVLDGELDDEQRDNVRVARDAAEGLLSIIDNLLDVGRLGADRVALRVAEMDFRDLVGECVRLLGPQASARGLTLKVRVANRVPRSGMADPYMVRRVLVNLLGNSIKFTERGGVEVDVDSPEPGTLSVAVRDTGVGISAEDRDRVWGAFVQADSSARRQYEGAGLGLAICRGLVELMGGHITLESEVGRGTTVQFEIPVEVIESAARAAGAPS